MSIKKLKLSELKIQSFVTTIENEGNYKGQGNEQTYNEYCSFGGYSQTSCGSCNDDPSYSTCNVVYCATNEQSCTNDGSATCYPYEGC